jgi:ubiquitin carboxyl-terminal hydrolase L3
MNSLVHGLGLSTSLAFQDVFSITEPALLAFVPRPAHALLLIFPVSDVYEKSRVEEDKNKQDYSGSGPNEPVIWYKQTIGNACGLIGLLHAVSNGEARTQIGRPERPLLSVSDVDLASDSNLAKLIRDAVPLGPDARAELLYESEALESAHKAAASEGDTTAPSADESVDLHFVCFVKSKDDHLWELDGRRKGPLDRGVLSPDDDVLSDKALDLGPKAFMAREAAGGDLRFSLISLVPNLD